MLSYQITLLAAQIKVFYKSTYFFSFFFDNTNHFFLKPFKLKFLMFFFFFLMLNTDIKKYIYRIKFIIVGFFIRELELEVKSIGLQS